MSWLLGFYRSTVGKKVIMGVTGVIGIGFVILHMLGNLQIFLGPEKMNGYARLLHGPAAEVLWVLRVVLIAAVVLHIVCAVQLTARSRASRPVAYARRVPQVSTWGARSIRVGGFLLLLFIPLHLMHFTTKTWRPAGTFAEGDIYALVVSSFGIWWLALLYIAMMVFMGLHLYHGAWSSLRTLGAKKASGDPFQRKLATGLAIVVWLGFTIVPLAIWAGALRSRGAAAAAVAAPASHAD
ncbi:MAG: succinate dehydrogenase cytochrome b subunit [Gemmatimonadaceae bacterium]